MTTATALALLVLSSGSSGSEAKRSDRRSDPAPAVPDLASVPLVEPKPPPPPPPLVTTSRPSAAVANPAPEEHSHALALALAGAGVVSAAFAVAGYVELASYDGYASGLQPGAASYSTVRSKLQSAQTWNVVAIVCTVAAAAGATAAVLTW